MQGSNLTTAEKKEENSFVSTIKNFVSNNYLAILVILIITIAVIIFIAGATTDDSETTSYKTALMVGSGFVIGTVGAVYTAHKLPRLLDKSNKSNKSDKNNDIRTINEEKLDLQNWKKANDNYYHHPKIAAIFISAVKRDECLRNNNCDFELKLNEWRPITYESKYYYHHPKIPDIFIDAASYAYYAGQLSSSLPYKNVSEVTDPEYRESI